MLRTKVSYQLRSNQLDASSQYLLQSDSNSSVDWVNTSQNTSTRCRMIDSVFTKSQEKNGALGFQIIYFQNQQSRSTYSDSHKNLLHKGYSHTNDDNRLIKYTIGKDSRPQYISQDQLRKKHYQFIEEQERQQEAKKFKKAYGNFPKPSKPIHRYFDLQKKCRNCHKRGHKSFECKQETRFFFSLMRNNESKRGLLIDMQSNHQNMEYIDY